MPAADRDLADLALLREVAREAGELARSWHGHDQQIWTKDNDSPVGEADLAVDRLLAARLGAARPDYAIVSEEAPDDGSRHRAERAFIVDPIDGTRDFLAGGKDWCVSLAVVAEGRPAAAAIFVPMHDELFEAGRGAGARLNGTAISVAEEDDLAVLRLAGTRRLLAPLLASDAAGAAPRRRYVPSLAYRLALVADGRLHLAVSRPGARDWDLAAADLVVAEAGGIVSDFAGRPIRYNGPGLIHPGILVASRRLHGKVRELFVVAENSPSPLKENVSP